YSYLGEFFASSSFLTVIPTHRLSDKSALTRLRKDHGLEDGLIQLTTNSKACQERPSPSRGCSITAASWLSTNTCAGIPPKYLSTPVVF
ncbi:MAG: hypothetical protein ACT4NK_14215, partial [Limnobacter sp.]